MSSSTPTPLTVLISGASGMIGRALRQELIAKGHSVHTLVRREPTDSSEHRWDPYAGTIDQAIVDYADAVVNLSGASLSRIPWTPAHKKLVLHSRQQAAQTLGQAIAASASPPHTLLQASAVGIYGNRGESELTEQSPPGDGFLASVTTQWEAAAAPIESKKTRVVYARTGLVIAKTGAMAPLRLQTFLGVAGPIGSGRQWWPWISYRDEIRALVFLLEQQQLAGPFNLVGPTPATAREVTQALARLMKRPHWLGLPTWAVKLMGEAGPEILLSSQKITPARLLEAGFRFEHQTIDEAIAEIPHL